MTSAPPSRFKLALAAAVVVLAALGTWRFLPRWVLEHPKPPIPKAFPACPGVATKEASWRGFRFEYPASWKGESIAPDRNSKVPAFQMGPRHHNIFMENALRMAIAEHKPGMPIHQAVDGAWALPPGETLAYDKYEFLGHETVHETFQTIEISGWRAVLYLRRGHNIQPRENDTWELIFPHKDAAYQIESGAMFNPYKTRPDGAIVLDQEQVRRNDELACGYWTVVKSLKLPN